MEQFSNTFRAGLTDLMRWRRDMRRFRSDPVDEALLWQCLNTFHLAPSVGLSEPWRIVRLYKNTTRQAALENFQETNAEALAVCCDDCTDKGHGLSSATMPEMRRYSIVGAINLMWLTARAIGLGLGWVSLLDPARLNRDIDTPESWHLVAYLCLGWPHGVSLMPELEIKGWEARAPHLHIESR